MKIRQFKMKNNFKFILIFVFLCLDLTWWVIFLKSELPLVRPDVNSLFVALGLFILACVLIPYYVSQILIVRCVNTLLNYRLRGVSRLCVLISVGISVLLFMGYVIVPLILGIDCLQVGIPFEWGVAFVALALYIVGKCLTKRKNTDSEYNGTNA